MPIYSVSSARAAGVWPPCYLIGWILVSAGRFLALGPVAQRLPSPRQTGRKTLLGPLRLPYSTTEKANQPRPHTVCLRYGLSGTKVRIRHQMKRENQHNKGSCTCFSGEEERDKIVSLSTTFICPPSIVKVMTQTAQLSRPCDACDACDVPWNRNGTRAHPAQEVRNNFLSSPHLTLCFLAKTRRSMHSMVIVSLR